MSWNFRVIKTKVEGDPFIEFEYGIHEVYYNLETGKPNGYHSKPRRVDAETIEELKWTLNKMLEALDKPVLTKEDFIHETSL